MIRHSTQVRVRYAETDQMGVVYHAHYITWFEVGRAEFIRELGLPYKEVEAKGILMPIVSISAKYLRPARYDDLLTIVTTIRELPGKLLTMFSEIRNESGELLVKGQVELAFYDKNAEKTVLAPPFFIDLLEKHWHSGTSNLN